MSLIHLQRNINGVVKALGAHKLDLYPLWLLRNTCKRTFVWSSASFLPKRPYNHLLYMLRLMFRTWHNFLFMARSPSFAHSSRRDFVLSCSRSQELIIGDTSIKAAKPQQLCNVLKLLYLRCFYFKTCFYGLPELEKEATNTRL